MKTINRVARTATKACAATSPLFWQPVINIITGAFLAISLLVTHSSVKAAGYHLILNGKSFHKEQPKKGSFNEENWGLGLQYDFEIYRKHWQPYLTASGFRDSYKRNSFYAGGGMMRRFSLARIQKDLNFGAGLVAFVMIRKDHHNRRPFLGALPAFTLGSDNVAVNLSYVPKVEPKLVPLWFIQLKISFKSFQ